MFVLDNADEIFYCNDDGDDEMIDGQLLPYDERN